MAYYTFVATAHAVRSRCIGCHCSRTGRVLYKMKRPMAGGRLELVLTPVELLRKLATLIPPPRKHSIRFHGVFAPNSSWRKDIVPVVATAPVAGTPNPEEELATAKLPLPSRIPWAELFRRVFKADVLSCARCTGRMRVIAYLSDGESVSAVLKHLKLPTTGPPIAPARFLLLRRLRLAANARQARVCPRAHFRAAVGSRAYRSSLCFGQTTVAWGADGEEGVDERWVICPMALEATEVVHKYLSPFLEPRALPEPVPRLPGR
jgi:hypothetical protein